MLQLILKRGVFFHNNFDLLIQKIIKSQFPIVDYEKKSYYFRIFLK